MMTITMKGQKKDRITGVTNGFWVVTASTVAKQNCSQTCPVNNQPFHE